MNEKQQPTRAERVERVRTMAAAEAARLLGEAASRIGESPEGFAATEKAIREGVQRIGASILAAAIGLSGKGYGGASRSCACGGRQKYMNDRDRRLVTLLGEVRFGRAYYWCPTCRESDAPLDGRWGIAHTDFSPALREGISLVGAEVPFGRGAGLLEELTGLRVSPRKHREISEATGASLGPARPPSRPPDGSSGDTLYLSTDGTMAPTRETWREVKLGAVFWARPGEDGTPERLAAHYLGDVMKADEFGWELYRTADRMGLRQARRTVVLGDGAAWIWNLAAFHFPHAIQIVDWYHATERLWGVAHAGFGEGSPEAGDWVARCEKLLRASRVERVINALRLLRRKKRKAGKVIAEAIGYYQRNAERMRYRRYIRQGLFIGSGVVEAGCKHIVGQRLKQSGMRWNLEGLRSILFLRLGVLNGQWPARHRKAA